MSQRSVWLFISPSTLKQEAQQHLGELRGQPGVTGLMVSPLQAKQQPDWGMQLVQEVSIGNIWRGNGMQPLKWR